MRRFVSIVLALTTLLAIAPQPARAQAAVGVFESASASWLVKVGKTYWSYNAVAFDVTEAGETFSAGLVTRTKCQHFEDKGFAIIFCFGFAMPRPIPDDAFVVDPLLDAASLEMRIGKHLHRVGWATGDAPQPYWEERVSGLSAGVTVSAARTGLAGGTLFGRRMAPSEVAFAAREVFLQAYGPYLGSAWEWMPDGRLRVERHYRISLEPRRRS